MYVKLDRNMRKMLTSQHKLLGTNKKTTTTTNKQIETSISEHTFTSSQDFELDLESGS